ncbi:MAG: GGDEF domain-containing protein [Endomicrobia bacterium]|nr:GGDEF domain-containing protein [Endomicrobiia bacterium]MCL2507099.1 GGDEF domain-containing protein [Endomicrobiia bacterium]
MNSLIIKKVFPIITAAAVVLTLYFILNNGIGIIVWSYFLVLAGLYCAKFYRIIAPVCSVFAVAVIIKYFGVYPYSVSITAVVFISVIAIPYYYFEKTGKEEKELSDKNLKLKNKYTEIIAEHSYAVTERQRYEDMIERIMQLYIIGRDLSKDMLVEEYVGTIMKSLLPRTGIISINIFDRVKNEWKPLAFSKQYQQKDWELYMQFGKPLNNEIRYVVIDNPPFCSRDYKTVFWPLKIENELLGCIIIVCEKDYASRYTQEGAIFGPQIALGTKRIKLFSEISEKTRTDGLTGLYLKRYFMERLQAEVQREKRYSGGFYILMLDLDHFKTVNDTYGHLVGDKVLCSIAKMLVDCIRPGDLVGRYGGEEFIIFMSLASKDEAVSIAQNIIDTVQKKKYKENDEKFNVTISVGISNYPEDAESIDQIISAADKALYKAKQNGRNQLVVYDKNLRL